MARKRRSTEVFSMAFLDCMSCGFGAVILFFMIINSHVNATTDTETQAMMAETNLLEIQVLEGRKNLALARNSIQKLETETITAEDRISIILALIAELQAELANYDNDTLAKIERVEKLQSDIESLEEEIKRLLAMKKQQDAAGRQVREFKGDGGRQYLTGLKLGGERTVILVDRSASMLHEKVVNILRRRNLPEQEQLLSRKWRQVIATVDWLTSQFQKGSEYQIFMFNNTTEPVLKGTEGIWLKADDAAQLDEAVRVLRRTVPKNGTNMHAAFRAAKEMKPPPDNIILLADSMPTMDAAVTAKSVIGGNERLNLFFSAERELPRGVPVNIMLYPMEGDFNAPISFWSLAMRTRGSFISVSRDWP